MPTKIKATGDWKGRRYDWNAVQQDRNAGMKVTDICAKYGCSDVSVYTRTVDPSKPTKKEPKMKGSRAEALAHVNSVDWTAAQNDRTDGKLLIEELAQKYGVSKSTIYKHTKNPNRKGIGSGNWPRKAKVAKQVAVIATVNGTANAHQLVKQALVSAIAEREKLDVLIKQLEAVNS